MILLSDIQPVSIFLPDDPQWMEQYEQAKKYFSQNLLDVYWVEGIHAEKWGLQGRHIYLLDGRPQEQLIIGNKKLGGFLSWYLLFHVCKALGKKHYMFLETDCKFVDGWRYKLQTEMAHVPDDFDFLFVGSCCAMDKEPVHVAGDVYEFPYRGEEMWNYYPQCGHCYIVAAKCLQLLIDTQRDTANPVDVSLIKYAFPKLKIYAILPRLADQGEKINLAP